MIRPGDSRDPDRTPEREAFRALAGTPRLDPEELRARLDLSADTFLGVWEGHRMLSGTVRRHLADLLREEIEWRRDVLRKLEKDVRVRSEEAPGGGRTRASNGREDDS